MAGQWFLVSDLKLTVATSADGVYAFAADTMAKQTLPDVPLQLLAADGRVLAEAGSGKDGVAFLAFAKDQKAKPALVTGVTATAMRTFLT